MSQIQHTRLTSLRDISITVLPWILILHQLNQLLWRLQQREGKKKKCASDSFTQVEMLQLIFTISIPKNLDSTSFFLSSPFYLWRGILQQVVRARLQTWSGWCWGTWWCPIDFPALVKAVRLNFQSILLLVWNVGPTSWAHLKHVWDRVKITVAVQKRLFGNKVTVALCTLAGSVLPPGELSSLWVWETV